MAELQVTPKVARYRSEYRQNNIGRFYSGVGHLAFNTVGGLLVVIACIMQIEGLQSWELWAIPAAFFYTNFSEYWGHRGPMHKPFKGLKIIFERHTAQHHRFFTHEDMAFEGSRDYHSVLFPPVMMTFFIGVFAVPFWALLALVASDNFAWLAVATGLAYFVNYELLHFMYHCHEDSWVGKIPGMAKLRWLHQVHHDQSLMSHYNFNITYPICDYLFGTLYKEKHAVDIARDSRSSST